MSEHVRPWPATAILTCLLLFAQGCNPPKVTRERAIRLITEQKLPAPVASFSYRLDNAARFRLLEACEEAGAITIDGDGIDLNVRVTPPGREYFGPVTKTRIDKTFQYTIEFRTPIPSRVLEITAIRDYGPRNKQVGYTWMYDCPPLVERCTTLNRKAHAGSAQFYAVKDRWKVK